MAELKYIIESLLFAAETPLSVDMLKEVIVTVEPKAIQHALTMLEEEYNLRKGGFFLSQVAGGYQLRSRPEFSQWIDRLVKPQGTRLSRAALETLSIIAYRQPVLRSDVEQIRGVNCGGVLRLLMEYKLIRILGRKEIPGRPLIYATTKKFLELFSLKDLSDLPTPREIGAIQKDE